MCIQTFKNIPLFHYFALLYQVIWDASTEENKVIFTYLSPSMEENYPGDLTCKVTYEITPENELIISYEATSSCATPINLTNHSYFNLAGHVSFKKYIFSLHLAQSSFCTSWFAEKHSNFKEKIFKCFATKFCLAKTTPIH